MRLKLTFERQGTSLEQSALGQFLLSLGWSSPGPTEIKFSSRPESDVILSEIVVAFDPEYLDPDELEQILARLARVVQFETEIDDDAHTL